MNYQLQYQNESLENIGDIEDNNGDDNTLYCNDTIDDRCGTLQYKYFEPSNNPSLIQYELNIQSVKFDTKFNLTVKTDIRFNEPLWIPTLPVHPSVNSIISPSFCLNGCKFIFKGTSVSFYDFSIERFVNGVVKNVTSPNDKDITEYKLSAQGYNPYNQSAYQIKKYPKVYTIDINITKGNREAFYTSNFDKLPVLTFETQIIKDNDNLELLNIIPDSPLITFSNGPYGFVKWIYLKDYPRPLHVIFIADKYSSNNLKLPTSSFIFSTKDLGFAENNILNEQRLIADFSYFTGLFSDTKCLLSIAFQYKLPSGEIVTTSPSLPITVSI